jgi:DnaK suppressor protein
MAKKASGKSSKKQAPKAKPSAKSVPVHAAKAVRPVAKPAKGVKARAPEPVVKKEEKPLVLKTVFKAAQLREYRSILQGLRDRVVDEISFLAGDNLNRSQRESSGDLSSYSIHMADQGTDNFDREFALNLVSSEQDVLYEIDDALRRIDLKSYGVCESCGKQVERARLKALPFAKMCIQCKAAAEKGKSRFRPFGPTISQTAEG